MKEAINDLNSQLTHSIEDNLKLMQNRYGEKVVFATSFGAEDQLITYYISKMISPISIFTLDTGRLFPETYNVWESTRKKYDLSIKTYSPNTTNVEQLVEKKGPYSFHESIENRKECCFIRKVEPLKRALAGNKVWVTGLRAEQSDNRSQLKPIEWDEVNQIIKFHPLLMLNWKEVMNQIHTFGIPYNVLHDKGFPSIGCQPCTRAVLEGEDSRAGRWWWENSKKECGLHQN
jgi:phosphoadenosine phosphosulfate reductase